MGASRSMSLFLNLGSATLNGTNRVNKLVAVGRYDSSSNTFNASTININVQ